MSEANSGMTLHSLVLSSDSFSCNCNSIQTPVSIVHLRVILTYLIPLLRVYINYSISNAIQFTSSMCSTAIEGGPFSYKLPPELAISRNMAGICIITQQ